MSREAAVSATAMVARSLKISGTTQMVMASMSAGIAANGAVAIQFLGIGGQAAILAMAFLSLAAAASAVSMDVYSRSEQVVSNLRSIGASRNSVSSAVVVSLIGYGGGGAVLGGAVGTAIGAGLSAGTVGGELILQLLAVVLATCGGMTAGIFYGARSAWHR